MFLAEFYKKVAVISIMSNTEGIVTLHQLQENMNGSEMVVVSFNEKVTHSDKTGEDWLIDISPVREYFGGEGYYVNIQRFNNFEPQKDGYGMDLDKIEMETFADDERPDMLTLAADFIGEVERD